MNLLRALLVSIATLLCIAGIAQAQAQAQAEAPAVPPSVDELETQVREMALKGKATPQLEELFFTYADARARRQFVPKAVSEEFWTWLTSNKTMHQAMLVMMHPDYKSGPIEALAALHEARPADVAKFPQLSVAFALVYGGIGNRPMRAGWIRNTRDLATVPTMLESFNYYVTNAGRMVYPLDKVPWPLLVYVADNDISLAERDWVFSRYGGNAPAAFSRLYREVPYDTEGLAAAADQSKLLINNYDYTLANIRQYGGVCADRAYYSSRVMKTFGVPAMYDSGQGLRGGHAWLVWIDATRAGYGMLDSGRFDYDNYYTGEIWNPVTRQRILDREAELVAAAMNASYDGYIAALAANHVYGLSAQEERPKSYNLLVDALKRNHYCAEIWQRLGVAVAEGTIEQKQGEQLFGQMVKPYGNYPDLTFRFLQDIIKPRLTPSEKVADREINANLAMLERAFAFYQQAKRPDLAVDLRMLQGQYLEANGQADRALKLYVAASQQYVKEHFGFIPLFDRAMGMMADEAQQTVRLRYLTFMANNVPELPTIGNPRQRRTTPAFIHVVKRYVAELESIGQSAEANKWRTRLPERDRR